MATVRIENGLGGASTISFRKDGKNSFTARIVNPCENSLWPSDADLVAACREAYPALAAYPEGMVSAGSPWRKYLDFRGVITS